MSTDTPIIPAGIGVRDAVEANAFAAAHTLNPVPLIPVSGRALQ